MRKILLDFFRLQFSRISSLPLTREVDSPKAKTEGETVKV